MAIKVLVTGGGGSTGESSRKPSRSVESNQGDSSRLPIDEFLPLDLRKGQRTLPPQISTLVSRHCHCKISGHKQQIRRSLR